MVRYAVFLLTAMGLWLMSTVPARCQTSAAIAETDPAGPEISLARDEPLYVRIAFTSGEPVSIWARPYFRGAPVPNVRTNASVPHAGEGDALGWFSFGGPGEVDEIRILVDSAHSGRARQVSSYRVHVVGTDQPAIARPTAAWVNGLRQQEDLIERHEAARRASEPESAADAALMGGFMLAMLTLLVTGVAAPAWGVWKWRGGWRTAASAPAALMAFVILRIVVDTARDPTSHNLWPFEILMFGSVSAGIMVVLAIARRISRANA